MFALAGACRTIGRGEPGFLLMKKLPFFYCSKESEDCASFGAALDAFFTAGMLKGQPGKESLLWEPSFELME